MSAATATAPAAAAAAVAPFTEADLKGSYKTWVAEAPGKPLVAKSVPHQAPAEDEVLVRIVASGICASDVDAMSGKYPPQMYPFPMVPGHEGVGVVVMKGKLVQGLKIGSRVGLGCYRGSCNACERCHTGVSNGCDSKQLIFANGAQGTFAEFMRIKAAFAVPIPDAVEDLEAVGPLFCAGATVFAPFVNHKISPGDHVAVVGLGGLGHLALKIANKWGCKVTAISRDKSKKDAVLALGAHHFVDQKEDPELKSVANAFNYVLYTGSGNDTKWNALLSSLAFNGKLVILGVPGFADIPVSPFLLILGQRSVVGSAAGSLGAYHQMINFCAAKGIAPINEKFAFDDINTAIERVKAGSLRFRAVVSHSFNATAAAAKTTTDAATKK